MTQNFTKFVPSENSEVHSFSLQQFGEEAIKYIAAVANSSSLGDQSKLLTAWRDTENALRAYNGEDAAKLDAYCRVLRDLAMQGWNLVFASNTIMATAPFSAASEDYLPKSVVQQQELLKRNEQLRKPSVAEFVGQMEAQRLHNGKFVSIYSLMRDGRELASLLEGCEQESITPNIIDPYVQIVESGARCLHTGLQQTDIWRYFRLTWSNQHNSVPGRTLMFLVRDAAVPYHPVIGIGSLCSAVVQMKERDTWIGWDTESVMSLLKRQPTRRHSKWLLKILDTAIEEIYIADLVNEGYVSRYRIVNPDEGSIARLKKLSEIERIKHRRFAGKKPDATSTREDKSTVGYWRRRAKTHLFRSKRASQLASLLDCKRILSQSIDECGKPKAIERLFDSSEGTNALRKIIKKARADRVGILIADINVCGAIAPYNHLHGGKLVSAIATSPSIIDAYRRKYKGAISEIASSMAGRPIQRDANLVFVGTTSLYGCSSAQYNRLNIPAAAFGSDSGAIIRFRKLGRSRSFGTSQFSEDTVESLVTVMRQSTMGQNVNSIFGEGVNPKLRKIRDGLGILNLPADLLLRHGRKRIIYGVALIDNLRSYLLGMHKSPQYLVSRSAKAGVRPVTEWWLGRWAVKRLRAPDTFRAMREHNLNHPVTHGARVKTQDESLQYGLGFEEREDLAASSHTDLQGA